MKRRTKTISLLAAVMLLVVATIFGTMAYLTSSDEVKNTFTVGNVQIKLDEAKVDENGDEIKGEEASRVKANTYHLLPGHEYDKDPTVTVLENSEDSYVRMKMTINKSAEWDAIFAPDGAVLTNIFAGYDATEWAYKNNVKNTDNTRTYEFWYKEPVQASTTDQKLTPLFTSITVPGFIDGEQLATIEGFEIVVTADAIQADGFTGADTAWAAFDAP